MARNDSGRPRATPLGKPPPRPERQAAFQLGLSAESRAAALLVAKGFRILGRRWKSPLGEIDIVARRRQLLVFVEVTADLFDDRMRTLETVQHEVQDELFSRLGVPSEVQLVTRPARP